MSLLLILSHLLAAAAGALIMAGYAMFLLAAAIWSKTDEDDGGDIPTDLPTPSDPPTSWKLMPRPDPASATPSSSPATAAGQPASAPEASTLPVAPLPTSQAPPSSPRSYSGNPATSAPPSAAPTSGPKPRATAILLDGPCDGLALVSDPTAPLTIATPHGRHRYIPTDRFDLNRRVFLHIGPIADPSIS